MVDAKKSALHTLAGLVIGRIPPQDIPTENWTALIELAQQHGLDGVLMWRLRQHSEDMPIASIPGWADLDRSARGIQVQYIVLEKTLREVLNALTAADVPAVWFKGAALAHSVYPDPAFRPMIDLDVLVPRDQRDDALKIIEGLGYHHNEPEKIESYQLFDRSERHPPEEHAHHYVLVGGLTGNVVVELHFQLLVKHSFLPDDGERWFWQQLETLTYHDLSLTILRPEAHLLYLCIHAILHSAKADSRLSRYLDIHWLITQSSIDWQTVASQAIALRWTHAVEQMLLQTRDYFATDIPESALSRLHRERPADEDHRRFARFYVKRTILESTIAEFRGMSPSERRCFVQKLFIPPRQYMRVRYRIQANNPVLPYYPYRWLVMLWKTGVSAAQLLRRNLAFWLRQRHDRVVDGKRWLS